MGSHNPPATMTRDRKTQAKTAEKTCYDTNSLRLITPRLCTYNVNVNRPYLRIPNVNRMFMVDMTYMPGYFIEEYPHKFYKNRAASWAPGSRPVALPPGLTKAGIEEKQQLKDYIQMKRQRLQNNKDTTVGDKPICIEQSPSKPSLDLNSKEYKRPLNMYDQSLSKKSQLASSKNSYKIFPPLREAKTSTNPVTLIGDGNDIPKQNCNFTAGKRWNMDKFQMWSGGTDGSVEFPKWDSPNSYNDHQNWTTNVHKDTYRKEMSEYARRFSHETVSGRGASASKMSQVSKGS